MTVVAGRDIALSGIDDLLERVLATVIKRR
jgi:hypothetical protein